MSTKNLPSLSKFEDKRITTGLKFVLGGASYTKTGGGRMGDGAGGEIDYVADATAEGGIGIRGFCSGFKTADEFYASGQFRDWLNEHNLN